MPASDTLALYAIDALDSEVAIIDADGTIVYTNAAWQQFAIDGGFPDDPAMTGMNYLEVCETSREDEYAIAASEGILSLLAGDSERFQMEYPCPTKSDPNSWFLLWARTFTRDGEHYVLIEHIEISDRKRAEQAVIDRNERLSVVSSVLSHDLRNPMAVALGYAEMLTDSMAGAGSADGSESDSEGESESRSKPESGPTPNPEALEYIIGALNRMDAIIDDAVVLSKQELEDVEPVDLHRVAGGVWDLIETKEASLESGDSLKFEADRSILESIFQNLFRNAIEHGGDGVTVGVGALGDGDIDTDRPTGFYIEDDGPGIPADRREAVFDAGYSSHSTDENSGLGLTIVKNAVGIHGWQISVTESATGGARFEIRIPDPDPDPEL